MEVTSEYLATLPEWIVKFLRRNNVTEVYDTEIDYKKWPGNFPVRIMRFGEPFILYQDEDDKLNLIRREGDELVEYYNVYPAKYSSSRLHNNLEADSWKYDAPNITTEE